ncbi:NAD+ kinase [Catalinimonas alkaloidigena]|uniref:NAD kinase n=1 Tax=Catalinimonas alkaloidigena TaxID=1075417 RepID=UPI0024052912|nr:NAD kinase [Catalinimonas alkaloidigena]MDF9800937.1 NAD+ kinase [Catalinimonas alkaloidigena]
MRIAIHGRKVSQDSLPYIQRLLKALSSKQVEIHVSDIFYDLLKHSEIDLSACKVYESQRGVPSKVNYTISIGGDGTLLETVTHVGNSEVPILGVNTGRLGFLATVAQDNIEEAVELLFRQEYYNDYRALISVDSQASIADGLNFALNEFTVIKKDTSAMIIVHAYVDDMFLTSYWADGLIVSTPTGSTGYSLSCGGPVVSPHSSNLIITPVSPHNLTVRPLVVSDDSIIRLKVESRSENFLLSLDSRSYTISTSTELVLQKSDFKVKLVKFSDNNFLHTLRQKLNWGLDVRN